MEKNDGFFNITAVQRDDIQFAMKWSDAQVNQITDDMMREIARKMADDYCEQLFWDHLPIIVEFVLENHDAKKTQPRSR